MVLVIQTQPIFASSMFNDQDTSDIDVLLNNNQTLHCHRVLLCSWSTVWAAALTDKKESSLDMTAHDAAIVELCLKYCYNVAVELTDENLTRVHLFAHEFNLEDLKSTCEREMTKGISLTNCMSLYCYFLKHSFPDISDARTVVTDFVCNEFTSIAKSKGFLDIDEDTLCQLLAEPIRAHEDDVLGACNRWLGTSPDPQVRERVLKLVRFPLLSGDKLIELRSYPWFQADLEPRYDLAMRWALARQVTDLGRRKTLRAQLEKENKLDNHLAPRGPLLKIESQILDESMKAILAAMLGSSYMAGRLIVNSSAGIDVAAFDKVVGEGPFVVIIESMKGHVFGAYIEDTFGGDRKWIDGSPNNFLFSLKNVPPAQQVVKLNRTNVGSTLYIASGCGLFLGHNRSSQTGNKPALVAFHSHSTAEDPGFELAPGYEHVGKKTLHGEFGDYTPKFMEVFAISELTAVGGWPKNATKKKKKQKKL